MTGIASPKILLVMDDAAEESHTSHILAKYHFTNFLVKVRGASDASRYFRACNAPGADTSESLPELILFGIRGPGGPNLSLALESRRDALCAIPLILIAEGPAEEAEIRRLAFPNTACISRPVGFFKLLEAMQKLGMRWMVLRPKDLRN